MTPAEIIGAVGTVAGIILSGSLIGAIVSWRRDNRQAPIERQQAEEASAKVQSEIRTADIDGLRDIIESLREEVATLRKRVETAEQRAATAEERAAAAERRAREADARAAEADHYVEILVGAWPGPPPPPARPRPAQPSKARHPGGLSHAHPKE